MSVGEVITNMNIPVPVGDQLGFYSDGKELSTDFIFEEDITVVVGLKQGKKKWIAPIAAIAIAVIAPVVAPMVLAAVAPAIVAGSIAATVATAAITVGITMVATLAVNALIPPPDIGGVPVAAYSSAAVGATSSASAASSSNSGGDSTAQGRADDVYFVTGSSNQPRYFDSVPSVYGTHKTFPDLAATSRIKTVGTKSEISILLDVGLGNVDVSDIRVADTPIGQLGLQAKVHQNTKNPSLKWISDQSATQQFAIVGSPSWQTVTSAPESTKLEALFQFSQGLYKQEMDGDTTNESAGINAQYKSTSGGSWKNFPTYLTGGKASARNGTISGQSLEPFVVVTSVSNLPPAQYQVRFRRNSAVSNDKYVHHSYSMNALNSYKQGKPLSLDKRHTLLEIYGVASEKLAGQVQTVNCIAKRRVREVTNTGWGSWINSSNPALIALDILTCEENPEPLKDGQIDFYSWKYAKDSCGDKFTFNGIFRNADTVKMAVNKVLSNCRAQLNINYDGKISVLVDEDGKIPTQLITPANSWDFNGSRNFPVYPHALRVGYVEKTAAWQRNEVIVYMDGYNASNAEKYETLETVGVTDRDEAWRYGRYMMAQARMRNESFTLKMDVEHLVVTRGDVISIQHDVPKFGGIAVRVMFVDDDGVVTIDKPVVLTTETELGVRVRLSSGEIVTRRIVDSTDETLTFDTPIDGIDYGDLVVIGELGKETQDYLVLSITPDSTLAAELTLTKYVPALYSADEGDIPPWDPDFGVDPNESDLNVVNVLVDYDLIYSNRKPYGNMVITWDCTGNLSHVKHYNVYYVSEEGVETLIAQTPIQAHTESFSLLANQDLYYREVTFRVEPVDILGHVGGDDTGSAILLPDTEAPLPVDGFGVNVVNNSSVDIFWHKNREPDIAYYELRYSPQVQYAKWYNSQKLARVDFASNRTTVGARTGSYLIIAVDTSGNKSTPVVLRTSVETLPALDLIEEVDDAPDWGGTVNNMVVKGGDLMLSGEFGDVSPRGTYRLKNTFDAGSIQELRIQAKLVVFGVTGLDYMSEWLRLSDVKALSNANSDEFDAWLEVRTADKFTVMADWLRLSDTDPLTENSNDDWSSWRRVESADVTGRIFQFRIVCVSTDPNVNVIVNSAKVEIDVAERYESYPDVPITNASGGVRIDFNPPFRSIPTLAITIDGSTSFAAYQVVEKTDDHATIRLVDSVSNNPITGQIDVAALGYGKQRAAPL